MSNTVDPKSSREEVYSALNSERTYQDLRWDANNSSSEGKHSIEEWLVYMEDYLNEAKHKLARSGSPDAQEFARHSLRKITAMGVAAMEQHGAEHRSYAEIEALRPIVVGDDEIPF